MSLDATRWAWEQTSVRPSDKLVLLSLADRADEWHRCYPTIARLSGDTLLDRKTVISAIDRLLSIGLIEADRRQGERTKYRLVGVKNRHETSTENGTSTASSKRALPVPKTGRVDERGTLATSTENGTGSAAAEQREPVPKTGLVDGVEAPETGTENGTTPVPKTGHPPVPKTGHEPTSNTNTNTTRNPNGLLVGGPPESAPSTGEQSVPHVEIIRLWNITFPDHVQVLPERWGGTREKNLRARWRENRKHQALEFWRWLFAELRKSKFHCGENDRGWRAELGWVLERRNFDKLLERFVSAQRRRAA